MRARAVAISVITATVGSLAALGFQSSPVNQTWPPRVQQVSDESPALSPEEALETFYMPPGYRVELVASEPMVQDPVAVDWDADGRLWVVELPAFVQDLETPEPNLEPIGRIVVLEDTDDDGRMDRRTVFVDRLVQGRSVKVLDDGVLVHEPPDVWLMRDTDGDLKADTRERIATGYGRREASVESNVNGFVWGLDNWLHSAGNFADFSLRLKDGRFDRRPTVARGQWGIAQDDFGRMFRNTNESAIHVDFVPTPYYARHPGLLRTRGSYDALNNDRTNVNEVWPVRPTPGTNRAYQFGIDRPDGTLAQFTAVCAPLIYRGDRLPAELYGNVFVAEPAANLVSRIILEDDGSALRARKAYPDAEFLASTDERFRPVFLSNAPDGTLYIVDLYRGILQDRASTSLYLRDYVIRKRLESPIHLGRIYRVTHESTRRDARPRLSAASPEELVQTLSHPNGWRRDTAQRLLVERGAATAVGALRDLAANAPEARTRVHALWTLDGTDNIDVPTVTRALGDSSRDVRASALRIAERWIREPGHPIHAAVLGLMDDADWAVRQQLAASLGELPAGTRESALATMLERHGDDPAVVDAALSGLHERELAVLDRLLTPGAGSTPAREAAVTMLAATVVRSGRGPAVQDLLERITIDTRPAWQRSAMLRGAEVALLNAAMPGVVRRGAPRYTPPGEAPCPTCPGGRGGPGGAYAFPDVREAMAAATGARGGGRGAPRLQLAQEPATFVMLAARGGDLGARAAEVLERLEWPDKPGAPAPAAPLSAQEQQRFEAGREIYRNLCQACHQADGRGLERVAPTLIGSTLALAPAEVTARILLNGKEGAVGLMPPLGMTLNDEQVAAALTYIRREWGHTAAPVDPATVAAVRAQTASRTRPWTTEELLALIPGEGN